MGGMSGPAIRPLAVRLIYEVHRAVPAIPIIGIGGVTCLRDALELMLAGASAIQVGTASTSNPLTCIEIIDAMEEYFTARDIRPADIVGQVRID
jgi:dihydroorotate dehydrogenase (NAD+) catalytic subunit